ncbi:hypothetical protein ACHAW5_001029 [Stephanodiscus triporus]|uniref:Uncharacterized protein n=1 Tax=Stephanodiscus triporus TaxID=2934178 RepID=A0ABD3PL06_9STRA
MSTAEEVTINPDGSTTFDDAGSAAGSGSADASSGGGSDNDGASSSSSSGGNGYPEEDASSSSSSFFDNDGIVPPRSRGGVDPALYLALAVLAFALLFAYLRLRRRRKNAEVDDFFSNLDGDKFDLRLPPAVDEYYEVKSKCEDEGWEPGQSPSPGGPGQQQQPSAHHRMLAQALMKRCIADIPIVSHIQRESAGMNKLYAQSMCSVKQWKSYQAAEAMVSAEVEEVRAEADEIEPGWSNVVWRQAMQYHNMLKQKEEQAKAQQMAQARAIEEKKKAEEEKAAADKARYDEIKARVDAEKARIANAERVAAELLRQEERERESKRAFSNKGGGAGIKKGFLG